MKKVEFADLGVMPYEKCWQHQRELFDRRLSQRDGTDGDTAGTVLFVEHPPVYTLGKSGREGNMLADEARLKALGAEFYRIDRGGDITFHGEGQIVCYPILDLSMLGIGLRRYVEILEQSVIDTVAEYGIRGERLSGATGVWICDRGEDGTARNWRKICAIGVRASRFVTMHGLALNVNTDLKWFTLINPCGFTDKGVTSIARECGAAADMAEVKRLLARNLARLLGAEGIGTVL